MNSLLKSLNVCRVWKTILFPYRNKELEAEIEKTRTELEGIRKQLSEAHHTMYQVGASPPRMALPARPAVAATPPQPPVKPAILTPQNTRPQTPGKPFTPCIWSCVPFTLYQSQCEQISLVAESYAEKFQVISQ